MSLKTPMPSDIADYLTDEELMLPVEDKLRIYHLKKAINDKKPKLKAEVVKNPEKVDERKSQKEFLIYSKKLKKYSVDHDKVATHLIELLHCKTIYGKKSENVYVYRNGMYECMGRELIKTKSEELLGTYAKTKDVNEIYEKIKRQTNVPVDYFDSPDLNLIPFQNGVFNLVVQELQPHSPNNKFTFIIPHIFDSSADCPRWKEFISECLYPEDIETAQEWWGFHLKRRYIFKKGSIFLGPKDTGKSVAIDTLIKFVGEKNKTGIPLQKISSGNDFTRLSLKDKHANVYDDLSSKDLSDGGGFKVATGGGYISAEEKFGDYIQFMSFAKQTFATNKIPPVQDNDDLAYFGRWIVFRFDNVPVKLDPYLRQKLWTENEMSGIINWSLIGLYRLLKNQKFSYDKTPEEVKMIMESSGCPLSAFALEVLEKEDNAIVTKNEMYQVYTLWTDQVKKPRFSKEQLGRQLDKYCSYILPEKHKERIWKNARIKPEWLDKLPKQEDTKTLPTLSNYTCLRNKKDENSIDIVKNNVSEVSNLEPFELEEVTK